MSIDYAPEIGKRFVTVLEEWLTPDEFEQVRTLNDARISTECHSHDFCDANMAMDAAFKDVTGRDPVYSNLVAEAEVEADPDLTDADVEAIYAKARAGEAADMLLMHHAWEWAIEHYLSHSATAVALEAEGFPEAGA